MKSVMRIGVPLTVLLALTFVFWILDADLWLARLVYGGNGSWPGVDRFPWDLIYIYAPWPAFIIAGISLAVLTAGFFAVKVKKYRLQALFFILLIALGPGLIVNVILKDNFGRARPRELVEFGGKYSFTQVWQLGNTGKNSSFPSGHASIAFYLIAPWFLLRSKKRPLALTFLILGLSSGSIVGAARILQGAHFLSDVLWAGGIVYISGEVLFLVLKFEPRRIT